MKTIITICILAIMGVTTVKAQNIAKFQFEAEVIDYGEIKKGSNGLRIIQFKNIGSASLLIDNVTCGCTLPSWTKTPVLPGETGEIRVQFNTQNEGPIRKTISIYSDASEPTKAIKVKGKVVE